MSNENPVEEDKDEYGWKSDHLEVKEEIVRGNGTRNAEKYAREEMVGGNDTRNAGKYARNRTVTVEMMPRAIDKAQVDALKMPDVEEKKLRIVKWVVSSVRVFSN